MSVPTHPIIELSGISFSYQEGRDVLTDVDLTIPQGAYLGIIGPNGGGKTTLIRLILGLIQQRTGTIRLFGTDSRNFKERYRIGYVSQRAVEFDSLFPATVEEVVLMGRYAKRGLFRMTTAEDRQKAEEALVHVNMQEYRAQRISDLSGGQKQRVFIARALASEPQVLVLDEPTTGIDHETEVQLYQLLKELNGKLGLTLILVSHDLARIGQEANSVAIVDRTLRFYANPAEAVAREERTDFHH